MNSRQSDSSREDEDEYMDDSDDENYMLQPAVSTQPEGEHIVVPGPAFPVVTSLTGSSSQFWNSILPLSMYSAGAGPGGRGNFNRNLKVYSIAMLPHARPELENGGKVILPPSALQCLTQGVSQLSGPMLFKATHINSNKLTHCGVLEFIADEGKCFMPFWMMHNIGANEGDLISVESVTIPIATFALFQPQSVSFLDISNPKALLENVLRNFACITKGEIIAIHYNDRMYELKILDTKPADAVNIIECDMNVDFAPPIGYVSPTEAKNDDMDTDEEPFLTSAAAAATGFVPFEGTGSRLDGKVPDPIGDEVRQKPNINRALPDFEWEFGNINFNRKFHRKATLPALEKTFTAFDGTGQSLRNSKSQGTNGGE